MTSATWSMKSVLKQQHRSPTLRGSATLISLIHSLSSPFGSLFIANSSAIAALLCPPTPAKFIKFELLQQPRAERMLQELSPRPQLSTNIHYHSAVDLATIDFAITLAFASSAIAWFSSRLPLLAQRRYPPTLRPPPPSRALPLSLALRLHPPVCLP
jgi:hypothetical protein